MRPRPRWHACSKQDGEALLCGLLAPYEAPFSNLHADGPEALFAGKETVISGIFDALDSVRPQMAKTG